MFRFSFVILALASALALNGCSQCSNQGQETAPADAPPAPPAEVAPPAGSDAGAAAPTDPAATPAADAGAAGGSMEGGTAQ